MNTVIQSAKLGPVSIDPDRLLTFPEGIPGFRTVKQYTLVNNDKGHPFFGSRRWKILSWPLW
ncbi:MAG: hypothetical protein MPW14_24270 [Candidatus Manganitrophus sp.]|nr:hypothetical protein [Candidatus Manganitrophus sp.]WDT72380.1 MAG: hypothetical protein MPW17_05970 [Candidatus Manganitrophus sp.]WDT75378.1 MAG: hypothetical protein MPW16_19185 [Candidatus Manganitrophus sp.]WDT80171.1 MAG: hypothetical protein MPW14_24270 [Candidatus Manganitrophus sp.]